MDCLDFAGLIAARLCHDLAGPISALANGAELLADETDEAVRSEFITMMGVGANRLAAKLRFLRLVFSGGSDPPVSLAEAKTALGEYLAASGRITADWTRAPSLLDRPLARLLLALALIAAEALERGGEMEIAQGPHGWSVRIAGPVVSFAVGEVAILRDGAGITASSRAATAHLALVLAKKLGLTIRIVEDQGEARLELA